MRSASNASVGALPAAEWDALTDGDNPFLSHAFLSAMEDSGSVGGRSGWQPLPLVIDGADGRLAAALPAYAKGHSQGEYVFDHSWADAWHRAGGQYYPKLQIAAPFTPATGPRILTRDHALALPLLRAAEQFCAQQGLSSAHATFIEPEQVPLFEAAGWLIRNDIQFHWENRGYASFDEFLAALSSRKRKDIRKERAAAQQGLEIRALTGGESARRTLGCLLAFLPGYRRAQMGPALSHPRGLYPAGRADGGPDPAGAGLRDGAPIAGALNFIGADALYGRYWGALVDKPFLHFELCYYQAIDAAIARWA